MGTLLDPHGTRVGAGLWDDIRRGQSSRTANKTDNFSDKFGNKKKIRIMKYIEILGNILNRSLKLEKVHLNGNSDLKKNFACKTFFRLF